MTVFTTNTFAAPSKTGAALKALTKAALAYPAKLKARRAEIARLRTLDAAKLRDIGLTEGDIIAASQLPLGQDVADALYRKSLERSGNW